MRTLLKQLRQRSRRIRKRRRRLVLEGLEDRRLLASDWQNPVLPLDVNADGVVASFDALVIINKLNENPLTGVASPLPERGQHVTDPFYDVDGDGMLAPFDVLEVVNALNRPAATSFEASNPFAPDEVPLDDSLLEDLTEVIRWQGRDVEVARGEWIVRLDDSAALDEVDVRALTSTQYVYQAADGQTPDEVLAELEALPGFRYAEPNFVVSIGATPNDPSYGQLWGLNDPEDNDIDAPEAWDFTTGSSGIVVGVIDTGVDYNHEDLAANMWTNPVECPAGPSTCVADNIDNDNNGYIDDFYGWDFINDDNNPFDDNSHGTHVAGTIAAVGNNGTGVVGVNWTARIMALKFLSGGGSGTTADAIEAVEYATKMKKDHGVNVRVTNNSWGGGGFSQALKDAIEAGGQEEILFVAAAGNSNADNDASPHYPSSYDSASILAVASTDSNDNRSSFSNFGLTSVDIGAPGTSIYSTTPYNSYGTKSGTSMASPHAAGVAALALSVNPTATAAQIKTAIMNGVDPLAALNGNTVTGGRLNAKNTLDNLGLFVSATSPDQGEVVSTPPTSFTLDFSQAYTSGTVDATDFTVNSTAANSFTLDDADTITFTFTTSPVTAEGEQTMALAADSIERLSDNDGVAAMNRTFFYDATPLVVSAITPASGSVLTLPDPTLVVDYSEAVAAGSVGITDLSLNSGSVSSATVNDADTVTYQLTGQTTEQTLNVDIPSGAVRDTVGHPNQAFNATYELDYGTVPFPATFVEVEPLGSTIHEASVAGKIHQATDTDTLELNLKAGQTISLALDPSATLAGKISVKNPSDVELGSASGAADQTIVLSLGPVAVDGTYKLIIESDGATTTGTYDLDVALNAHLENEQHGGGANGTLATAQDLSTGWSTLSTSTRTLAARGSLSSNTDVDWYEVSLIAGQPTSFTLEASATTTTAMTLHQADGTLVATAASIDNADEQIQEYLPGSTASYFVQISGDASDYGLTVNGGASFDTEANDSQATAQNLNATLHALGHAGSEPLGSSTATPGREENTRSTATPGREENTRSTATPGREENIRSMATPGREENKNTAKSGRATSGSATSGNATNENENENASKSPSSVDIRGELQGLVEDAAAVYEYNGVTEILWAEPQDPRPLINAIDSAPEGVLAITQDHIPLDALPEGDIPRDVAFTNDGTKFLVANRDTDNVMVYDTATRNLDATIPVGQQPLSLAMSPNGNYALTANSASDSVTVIDLNTNTVAATVPVSHPWPYRIRVAPDGQTAVVATLGRFIVIDMTTFQEANSFASPGLGSISAGIVLSRALTVRFRYTDFAITPDSSTLVAPGFEGSAGRVRLYSLATGTERASLPTPAWARSLTLKSDGTAAYVSTQFQSGGDYITKIDLTNDTVAGTLNTESIWGSRLRLTPDELFAITEGQNKLIFVDLSDGTTSASLSPGAGDFDISHDGAFIITPQLRIIDIATKTEVAALQSIGGSEYAVASPTELRAVVAEYLGGDYLGVININGASSVTEADFPNGSPPEVDVPTAIAFTSDGSKAVTANYESDNATIIDMTTQTVLANIDTGVLPDDVAITPDDAYALVTSPNDHSLTVIDLATQSVVKTLTGLTTHPRHILISADSSTAYITTTGDSNGQDKVYFVTIDGANTTILDSLVIGDIATTFTDYTKMALSPDGTLLAVPASRDDELVLVDTASRTIVARLITGSMPMRSVFSPDGTKLYTVDDDTDTITVIHVAGASSTVETTIPGLSFLSHVIVDGTGDYLYATRGLNDTVEVIDTSTYSIVKTITLPDDWGPGNVALSGNVLYVEGTKGIVISSPPLSIGESQLFRIFAAGPSSEIIDQTPLSSWSREIVYVEPLQSLVAVTYRVDGLDVLKLESESSGDEDFYQFTPSPGDTLTITAQRPGISEGPAGNSVTVAMELYDAAGTLQERSFTGTINHTVAGGGTFTLRVYALGFTEGEYFLEIAGATNTERPIVSSIVRQTPPATHTNADEVTFRITFSEGVVNVGTADFAISGTAAGDGSIGSVTSVNASTYDVTITGLTSSNGTIDLDIANGNDVEDLQGTTLGDGPSVDYEEFYTIDNTAPTLNSFTRFDPTSASTVVDVLTFRATFNEDMSGVDAADFAVDGTSTATVTSVVAVSGSQYNVTVSGGDLAGFNGDVGLNLSGSQDITDLAGNALPAGEPGTDELYTLANSHDMGDAPSPYPVTLADSGARHESSGLQLGLLWDDETDATNSANADSDDTTDTDDEDGVVLATVQVGQLDATLTVNVQNAPSGAKLDAWIDFDRDGNWGGPNEQIADAVSVIQGNNVIEYDIPAWAAIGTTYGRFRLSTSGDAGFVGLASDGEVEDHPVPISAPTVGSKFFGGAQILEDNTGFGARVLSTADVDGDGDMDIFTGSGTNNHIAWHENDGNQSFTKHLISTSSNSPMFVHAVDLEGDGDMDVLVASQNDDTFSWYENDGAQNFSEQIISSTADGAKMIFPADMNGDGNLDVVGISDFDDTIAWFENDGLQGFTRHVITSTSSSSETIAVADLDSDGDLDVVTDESQIAWYENDGAGSFTRKEVHAGSQYSVATADVDNDGDMDVLVSGAGSINWYENDGSEVFTFRPVSSWAGSVNQSRSVASADVDGDGDMDVLSASSSDNKVAWYENDGSQNFTQRVISLNAKGAVDVIPSDLDGDGDIDVLAALTSTDQFVWYEHQDDPPPMIDSLSPADDAAVVALDANLVLDFNTTVQKGAGTVTILKTADDSVVETIDITATAVTVSGSQVTINPTSDFSHDTGYYVLITPNAIEDASGNRFYGFDVKSGWNFTTLQSGVDYGDAPDTGAGTGTGNYNTLLTDTGPSHNIVAGLYLGHSVDQEDGTLQNGAALADDKDQATPDDEDGLNAAAVDLLLTSGGPAAVNLLATNLTGAAATLTGWIDFDNDGSFEPTERAQASVADGTDRQPVSLSFLHVPSGSTGPRYARFRLGSDAAAGQPTGASIGGEVEDHVVWVVAPNPGTAQETNLIGHETNGGPTLTPSDYFGYSVVTLGDLDGDGIPDLAIGAPQDDTDGSQSGAVYIAFMKADGTVREHTKLTKASFPAPPPVWEISATNYFGSSVAALGDLDGDDIPDLAVGRRKTGGANPGSVFILFMNSDGTIKDHELVGHQVGGGPPQNNYQGFGHTLAGIGDLDGDGVNDLAAGAYLDDTGGSDRGGIFVLLMNPDGTVKRYQQIADGDSGLTLSDFDNFGISVAGIGDLDGDGVTELAVGAYGDDTGSSGTGAVYILFMNTDGTAKSSLKIGHQNNGGPSLTSGDAFGTSVTGLGDIDADGVNDIAVGAYLDDTGGFSAGAVHVLLLNSDGTVKGFTKIADNTGGGPDIEGGDLFGRGLALVPDLNGDGLVDLAVGAERDDTGGTFVGAVHLLLLDSMPQLEVTVDASTMSENGGTITGTVTRANVSDITGSLEVTLLSSDTSEATVGATVTIPANQASETFTITAVDDNLADGAQLLEISGAATGFVTGYRTIEVTDDETAAPTAVDLVAASDTGTSSTDNITKLDNSAAGSTLQFSVSGTLSGATVTLYQGTTVLGSAVATSSTTTITTNGTADLADGSHSITAKQTLPGRNESAATAGLSITVDTVAPRIESVRIGSTSWTTAFKDAVDTISDPGLGYPIPEGANQLDNLTFDNIDEFILQFSENVSHHFVAANLALVGTNKTDYEPFSSVSYNTVTFVGTISLSSAVGNDVLILAVFDTLTDVAGNALDGEWTDGTSTQSGDNSAGGQFNFRIDVLPGDVTNNGGVNSTDLLSVREKGGTVVNDASDAVWDVNGNGGVNSVDLQIVRGKGGTVLPGPPSPPSP